MSEPPGYAERKSHFDRMLTVYGRKAVLEALTDSSLDCATLHLAHSNRDAGIIRDIRQAAQKRDTAVREHSREGLSRISKNGRQDQGVALDIRCPAFRQLEEYLREIPVGPQRILALDGITNPQNLGMVIRSATAGSIDGIVLPRRGTAALGPLVIKASAGTVFRAPLLLCQTLPAALQELQAAGAQLCALDANSPLSLFEHREENLCVYVLGNETEGISQATADAADVQLSIPMRNGVESLNVAVTASLVAFGPYFDR